MSDGNAIAPRGSPAVHRAAEILFLLSQCPGSAVGPSEISRRTGIAKSTVLDVCAALVDTKLLRSTDQGYALGRRLVELGQSYVVGVHAVEEFYKLCREWLDAPEQTVQLAVLGDGLEVVYLGFYDGREPLRLGLASGVGRRVPAHCTAAGKALLAALRPDILSSRLPQDGCLSALTERSITSAGQFAEEIEATRQRGYAIDDEETMVGLRCVASAVVTPRRHEDVVAISFTFRKEFATEARHPLIVRSLLDFVQEFRARIGGDHALPQADTPAANGGRRSK